MDIAFINERFRALKQQRKYKSARAIAEAMQINRHTINKILAGDVHSERDKILFRAVLNHMDVTEDAFFNRAESAKPPAQPSKPTIEVEREITVPLLGSIPAGHPVTQDGVIDSEVQIPLPPEVKSKNLFALRVKGVSMLPYLEDGDIVYLEPIGISIGPKDPANPAPKHWFDQYHGKIVASICNGDATLKILQVSPLGKGQFDLYLMPINQDYDPIYITESCEVLFQGAVVHVARTVPGVLHNHMRAIPSRAN